MKDFLKDEQGLTGFQIVMILSVLLLSSLYAGLTQSDMSWLTDIGAGPLGK